MLYYQIPKDDKAVLDEMNIQIKDLIKKRTEFLDSKMEEHSDFKIGDDVYDESSGQKVGVGYAHKRHHRGSGGCDTSFGCCVEILLPGRIISNTSASKNKYVTKEDLKNRLQAKLRSLNG